MSRVDGKSGKSGHRWPRFHSLQEACAYLAEGYRQMEAETPVRNEDTEKKVLVVPERVDAMMPFWRDSPLRRPLETLVEHLRNVMPEGCIPILAGSLSRMEDWTPYADVDLGLSQFSALHIAGRSPSASWPVRVAAHGHGVLQDIRVAARITRARNHAARAVACNADP